MHDLPFVAREFVDIGVGVRRPAWGDDDVAAHILDQLAVQILGDPDDIGHRDCRVQADHPIHHHRMAPAQQPTATAIMIQLRSGDGSPSMSSNQSFLCSSISISRSIGLGQQKARDWWY